jgi:hypothetical protein
MEGGGGMIRGTTPTLEFVLPFETSLLAEAYVTLAQSDGVVLDKPLSECTLDGNKMTVKLTQEDTLKLKPGPVEIQIRAKTENGDALASDIILTSASKILKDGAI